MSSMTSSVKPSVWKPPTLATGAQSHLTDANDTGMIEHIQYLNQYSTVNV